MKRILVFAILLIALSAASFAGVSVTAPMNGATVTSPVNVVASGRARPGITGMSIYVDSKAVYSIAAMSLNTSIAMSTGQHTVVVNATNSTGKVYSDSMTLTVAAAGTALPSLQITTSSLPSGTVGSSYSTTMAATGGTAPYKFTVPSGLPLGTALMSNGSLSGTPTTACNCSFTITLTDSSATPQSVSKVESVSVAATSSSVPALSITTSSLATGAEGTAYSASLAATGGTAPYTFSAASGLPTGLALASNGSISGTPTAIGTFSFTVTAKDSEATPQTVSKAESITISAASKTVGPLSITTTSLASATAGTGYSATLGATGGTAPYTWSIASGSLPAGVTLSTSGVISGTPTASGSFVITADVKDSEATPQLASYSETLTVAAPAALAVKPITLSSATTGSAYSATLSATGGIPAYTWSVASGALPTGLTLSSSGAISGTPTATGTFSFTAQVKDSEATPKTATTAGSIAVSGASTTVAPPSQAAGYNLVFDDEFTTLNISTNREGAYNWYEGIWWNSNISPMSDITDTNGVATLNWVNGQGLGSTDITGCSQNGLNCHTYRYGYFEASMKWTPTTGAWPAFWLIPVQGITSPTGEHGEIDIFEGQGTSNVFYGTIHDWDNSTDVFNNNSSNAHQLASSVDLTQFHTYGVLWVPGKISWYFDNQLLSSASTDAIFDEQDFYPVFSSQEGINWSEGSTTGVTASTMPLSIDWIHIFQN
jgi:hypothetical protein